MFHKMSLIVFSNLDFYQVPEKELATIEFSKENLAIEVSNEELDQAYESYLQSIPTAKRVSHLMIILITMKKTKNYRQVNSIETVLTAIILKTMLFLIQKMRVR